MEMWNLSGDGVNANSFCDKKVWRSWVRAVRDLVEDWDGFEHWDWGHFSNELPGPDFYKFTVLLLTFFIQSFVRRLGYYPSPLLRPPTLSGHTCADHRKRFEIDS